MSDKWRRSQKLKDTKRLIPSKSGYKRMTTVARETGQDINHERLNGTVTIAEAGYMYIYISNEEGANAYEVYFDDLKVEHIKSPVIQEEDYYPFGLVFNSYTSENNVPNLYEYNGKERQDELDLGWLDYGARMYMAEIARWNRPDRLAEAFVSFSPYHYAANDPINFFDVNGDYFTGQTKYVDAVEAEAKQRRDKENAKIGDLFNKLTTALLTNNDEALESIKNGITSTIDSRDGFQQTLDEIDKLRTSDQEYHIADGLSGSGAATSWNSKSNAVQINIAPDADKSLIGDELKHAYQFEVGEISFGVGPGGLARGDLLLDLGDEVAGYQRQALFNKELLPDAVSEDITVPNVRQIKSSSGFIYTRYPEKRYYYHFMYSNIPGQQAYQLPVISDPHTRDLAYKRISNIKQHAFRSNGKTYYPGVK